ncbi:MAG: hypothetical protein ACMUJM_19290 [bacterium]
MITEVPKTALEFQSLMEEIDDYLRKKIIPIYNRPIHAPIEIGKRLKISLPLVPLYENANPNDFSGNSLSNHIQNWYEKRYGDRLKAEIGIGSGVILIKNDPWKVVFPKIFGSVYFVCDADIDKYENPQYGLSKWSSLQFSEKLLKSYLKYKGKAFPHSQDLLKLTKLAEDNGLPKFPKQAIDQVQCPAGVRYSDPPVTLKEAVRSHYASIGICFFVSKCIF